VNLYVHIKKYSSIPNNQVLIYAKAKVAQINTNRNKRRRLRPRRHAPYRPPSVPYVRVCVCVYVCLCCGYKYAQKPSMWLYIFVDILFVLRFSVRSKNKSNAQLGPQVFRSSVLALSIIILYFCICSLCALCFFFPHLIFHYL